MANIKELSDGGPDGTRLGQSSTDKVGFYGLTTPIARRDSNSQAAVTITAVTAVATTTVSAANTSVVFGFASSTAAQALVTRVQQLQVDMEAVGVLLNRMRADLVAYGLIGGAA